LKIDVSLAIISAGFDSSAFLAMAYDVKRRVLLQALEIAGDRERLATQLGTRKLHLDSWLSGFSEPPDRFFLRAIDIILGDIAPDTASASERERRH
jgi:hypothetical protein